MSEKGVNKGSEVSQEALADSVAEKLWNKLTDQEVRELIWGSLSMGNYPAIRALLASDSQSYKYGLSKEERGVHPFVVRLALRKVLDAKKGRSTEVLGELLTEDKRMYSVGGHYSGGDHMDDSDDRARNLGRDILNAVKKLLGRDRS
jgi:hypothetical protein